MREQLITLGYSSDDIRNLKPQMANDILESQLNKKEISKRVMKLGENAVVQMTRDLTEFGKSVSEKAKKIQDNSDRVLLKLAILNKQIELLKQEKTADSDVTQHVHFLEKELDITKQKLSHFRKNMEQKEQQIIKDQRTWKEQFSQLNEQIMGYTKCQEELKEAQKEIFQLKELVNLEKKQKVEIAEMLEQQKRNIPPAHNREEVGFSIEEAFVMYELLGQQFETFPYNANADKALNNLLRENLGRKLRKPLSRSGLSYQHALQTAKRTLLRQ